MAPGIIDTDMNKNLNKEEIEEIKNEIPLRRVGSPKDVADCIFMLTQNNYITGEVIKIDGGWIG